jgi:serine/threonine-protein kinase
MLPSVPRDQLEGTTLGGYTIRDYVGEGGTATVYRADHPTHGAAAFKLLRQKLRADKTAVARFLREAAFGARVQHPNVVRTLDVGEATPGMHFLAIEWAPGDLLERYAKKNTPLSAEEVAAIVPQIAAGVFAAHQCGIIHRDLKPDNVMYDPLTRSVKLLDFGIATDADVTPEDRLTRTGFFVGSMMYVAPEALSGVVVTPAADQYSLATIAYYLLVGTLPYAAKTPREMFTQLLSQPPIPLNKARPGLTFSPEVEQVLTRGLARNPGDRYPDVIAFATALRDALFAQPAPRSGLFSKVKGLFGGS